MQHFENDRSILVVPYCVVVLWSDCRGDSCRGDSCRGDSMILPLLQVWRILVGAIHVGAIHVGAIHESPLLQVWPIPQSRENDRHHHPSSNSISFWITAVFAHSSAMTRPVGSAASAPLNFTQQTFPVPGADGEKNTPRPANNRSHEGGSIGDDGDGDRNSSVFRHSFWRSFDLLQKFHQRTIKPVGLLNRMAGDRSFQREEISIRGFGRDVFSHFDPFPENIGIS